jgi:signal transduction histidine kinase
LAYDNTQSIGYDCPTCTKDEAIMTTTTKQSALSKTSTVTLLRVTVMLYWFMLGIQIFVPSQPYEAAKHLLPWYLEVMVFLGFGPAFWVNTRNIAVQSLDWLPLLLLSSQAIAAFTINSDLIYIVAAEIPLVLPARAAVIWIVVQNLPLTALIFWVDQAYGAEIHYPKIPLLPHPLIVLLSFMSIYAFNAFAFFMGRLVVSEARGRRAAERLNAELLATQDLLAQSSRLAEREFVARELHDALGHHLVALKVNLELAQNLVAESSAKTPIGDALSLVKRLLSEVRDVVSNVRTQPRMELRKAIETLLTGVSELSIELIFPDDIQISDPSHAHILFRCVQEAVTNTLKHAKAKKLWIQFSNNQHAIFLTIRDDGVGTPNLQQSHGLQGMRERLESVASRLEITHAPGRGFTLTACIPKPDRL